VTLEAEIERLKAARAEDADLAAEMLVRIAEAERQRMAAQARCAELEAEVAQTRDRAAAAEARFEGNRMTMASAVAMLDELERREEMAASIRTRSIAQARAALLGQGRTAPPPAESSFDAGWDPPDEGPR
jgi:chromosome segregation ATPase